MFVSIETKVKMMIAEILEIPLSEVLNNKNLKEDLKADTLDIIELVIMFEEEFKIDILDDEIQGLKTVKAAIFFIIDNINRVPIPSLNIK